MVIIMNTCSERVLKCQKTFILGLYVFFNLLLVHIPVLLIYFAKKGSTDSQCRHDATGWRTVLQSWAIQVVLEFMTDRHSHNIVFLGVWFWLCRGHFGLVVIAYGRDIIGLKAC